MAKIICIAGPTASGKTALAVELAKALGGQVISCDSMQVYRHMDIGTAKPTPAEMQGIPHHMLDVAEPEEDFSVSRYCAMATPILEDLMSHSIPAIVAGGTGLYMDALIRGNTFAPAPSTGRREELERQADREGIEPLLSWLRDIDPETAARLHPGDRKRILRSLEIYLETGETMTAHNQRTQQVPPKFQALWLGLCDENRQDLYDRIDRRVEGMMERGLLDEIRSLLAAGVPKSTTAMQAIGYKEFLDVLDGRSELSQAIAQVQQSSRRYAKRQLTWFRRNPAMHWLRRGDHFGSAEILATAFRLATDFDK